MQSSSNYEKVWLAIAMAVCVGLGLLTKIYQGPFDGWIKGSSGGIFYVLFFCLFARFVFSKTSHIVLVVGVLLATCAVEFSQLYQAQWLNQIRANHWARLLLGNQFAWSDFPPYLVGAVIALGVLRVRTFHGHAANRGAQAEEMAALDEAN